MRVRFQADADLDGRVLRELRRAEPGADIRTAADAGLAGLEDSEVLKIAADSGRILVSQDRRTIPLHFDRYVAGAESPRSHPASGGDSHRDCGRGACADLERQRSRGMDQSPGVDSALNLPTHFTCPQSCGSVPPRTARPSAPSQSAARRGWPMAHTKCWLRIISIPPERAGVAMTGSAMSLRARSSNLGPAFTTTISPSSLER